jgi:bifunctional non-homologous end joining protein LigD
VKAALPAKLGPQLASPSRTLPGAGDWIYEIKFDGYRLLARIDAGVVRLFTRRGHDWTAKMPALAEELERLHVSSAWLDGEIVVIGEDGAPDFNAAKRVSRQRCVNIGTSSSTCVFRRLDLRRVALRAAPLEAMLEGDKRITCVQHGLRCRSAASSVGAGREARRPDRETHRCTYMSERTSTQLKLKCRHRQNSSSAGIAIAAATRRLRIMQPAARRLKAMARSRWWAASGPALDAGTAADLKPAASLRARPHRFVPRHPRSVDAGAAAPRAKRGLGLSSSPK